MRDLKDLIPFTIVATCGKGHSAKIRVGLQDRDQAGELVRLMGTKCATCDAPLEFTISQDGN